MDANETKKLIMKLNGEIEEILQKAGHQEFCTFSAERVKRDSAIEVEDILSHLGYINSVVKGWDKQ